MSDLPTTDPEQLKRRLQRRITRLEDDIKYDRLLISRPNADAQLKALRKQLEALKGN
jgi:hypothetical protein